MSLLTRYAEPRVKLTARERLLRGVKGAAIAPLDIGRGSLGLSYEAALALAGRLRQRGQNVADEVQIAVADVVDTFPAVAAGARKRRLRKTLITLAAVGLFGAGAVAFSALRKSGPPEPSPLAPSVNPQPQP